MTRARRILLWTPTIAAIATVGLLTLLNPKICHAASSSALLTGTVMSASGERMEGVTVSAKIIGQTITTSVFTDDQGKYHFPPMQDGKYWVWAQAVAFDAPRVDINLHNGVQHRDFVMKPTEDFFPQLTGAQQIAALPEDTPAHRRMKDIFTRNCVGCHEANVTLQNRLDEQGWKAIIWAMSRIGAAGGFSPAAQAVPEFLHYRPELAAYLAEMRGPGPSPMQLKVPPRPSGESTLPVIYTYDVPVDEGGGYVLNNGSDWSLGPSSASGGGQGLHDAQVDFNGNLWVTHADSASVDRTITKVDGNTGEVTNFRYPRTTGPLASNSHGVTIARDDGTIWFTMLSEQKLGTIDPKTNNLEVFTPPAGMAGPFVSCDEDGLGNIWSSTLTGAIRFDRKTQQFTQFTALTQAGLFAYGAAGDRDGNGWWTEINVDIIGHSDIKTGATHEITVPPNTTTFLQPGDVTPDDLTWYGWEIPGWNPFPSRAPFGEQMPRRLAADHDGDSVWVPDNAAQNLLQINIDTLQTTFYTMPRPALRPYMAVVDNGHDVWMNLLGSDEFAKFDPKNSQWTFYSWPNRGTGTRGFHILERGGVLQVSAAFFDASTVAKAVFRTKQDVDALEALEDGR
jgi:streptogramin lyase